MVKQVPLDYMHLTCLGMMKRLMMFWIKGNQQQRMFAENVDEATNLLLKWREFLPYEFARLPRPLADIAFWKAAELQQFLLYTGPIVLKNTLNRPMYIHFMCLHVSIRILCSHYV